MENFPTNGKHLNCFSPENRIKKNRRRLSRPSSKKYFRRSLMYERVQSTIPNKSLTIIEISSTDDSSESIRIQSPKSPSLGHYEDIISPSPNKNDGNWKCSSTRKKKINKMSLGENISGTQKGNDCDYKVEYVMDPGAFLEFSLLDYDNFQKPRITHNALINSTMLKPEETIPCLGENDLLDPSNFDDKLVISCENVLDEIYGDSWRPFREKVLPKSERKPQKKKISVGKQVPATERKVKKSEVCKSPYVENEEQKFDNLLKTIRTKLNFEENLLEDNKVEEKENPELKDDFCWASEENSFEKLSLKDRLEQKILKEKNLNIECEKPSRTDNNKDNPTSTGKIPENDLNLKTSKITKNVPIRQTINEKYQEAPSSSDESFKNSKGNDRVKKKVMKKKYFDSSNSSDSPDEGNENSGESYEKVPTTQNKNSNIEENQKVDKKLTKKASKIKFSCKSSEDSDDEDYKRRIGDILTKNVLSTKTIRKPFSENSLNSGDFGNDKVDLTKRGNLTKTHSFLSSLSSNIPDHECDPTAKIFKANFKNNKEELAKNLFILYNKNIFDDLIPKDTALDWNARLLSTAGYCYSKKIIHADKRIDLIVRIVLSSKVLTTPERLRDTLVHEMCHAATWIIDGVRDGHGSYWKAWAEKARKVYPELPLIKTCHNYEINSKYVYRCTGCGYKIRRHRKSLDIERKRCGYCKGKFEIFINSVNKKGEHQLKPADTPKKPPKGFALFVQENYSKYKNTNAAEVMKLLSKEFNKLKV